MEAFDFPVRLRPVGAGLFDLDAQFGAGITPKMRFVGRAVVGEDPFDGDAAGGEPGHRSRRLGPRLQATIRRPGLTELVTVCASGENTDWA